jgi:hypothetical protein
MPKLAYYDHTKTSTPVLGWYDTDATTYPTMPDQADLLPVTDAQWLARLSTPYIVNGVPAGAPPSDAMAAGLALATAIASGITIASTGTPALNGVYALDALTMDQVGAVARDAASGLGLPGGGSTFEYPDRAGTPMTFTEQQIIGLYKAMRDLLLGLNTAAATQRAGGTPTWPPQTGAIP